MTNLLLNALSYANLRERKGSASDPIILDMIHTVFPNWKDDSTIAWCSCCINMWAISNCYENTMHQRHPGLARGWLQVGEPVERKDLRVGDVVIFDRGPGKGHVGLFLRDHGTHITVYGGNQGNAITVSDYRMPFLGGRRLRSGAEYEYKPNAHV